MIRNFVICIIFCLPFASSFAQPDNKQSKELLAAQFYQNKEFDKAAQLYEELFTKEPSKYYYTPFFDCLIQLKDYDKAEKTVKKLAKTYKDELSYIVDLGLVYELRGDAKKSIKTYDDAIKSLLPNEEQALELANAFASHQLYDYAIRAYDEVNKKSGGMMPFYMEKAGIFKQKQDIQSMVNEYLTAIGTDAQYFEVVQNRLQDFINNDVDNKKIDLLRQTAMRFVKKDADKRVYYELLIWIAIQTRDFESAYIQSKAIDRQFKEEGQRVFEVANIALENEVYDIARECYKYIISKGEKSSLYYDAKMALVNTMYKKLTSYYTSDVSELAAMDDQFAKAIDELGITAQSFQLVLDYAHFLAFYKHNTSKSQDLLNKLLEIQLISPRNKAIAKTELGDVLLLAGDVWESSLLYSQVEKAFKNEPIGHDAKLRNAKLAYYRGDFYWALSQLDILKAATSKLIANDAMDLSLLISDNIEWDSSLVALSIYSRADLLFYQNKFDSAMITLDTIKTIALTHPIFDEVLYLKAKICLKTGDVNKALTYLEKITAEYGDEILGDESMFLTAELYEKNLNNKEKAMALYKDFMLKYPGSIYTTEARKRYRNLRGDNVN